MLGAIFGDTVGSVYEYTPQKSKDFTLFQNDCTVTDDTVMTLAVANALMEYDAEVDSIEDYRDLLIESMHRLGRRYPLADYSRRLGTWLAEEQTEPYNGLDNGAATRVSPVAWYASSLQEACLLAQATAEVTHNHSEGIKGAVVTAGAIYLARTATPLEKIRDFVSRFYPMDFTLEEIRPDYRLDKTCEGCVPQAMQAFLEAWDFEDAIRNAISLGGDSNALAAITGAVAEAYYGITAAQVKSVLPYLDTFQRKIAISFCQKFVTSIQ